MPKSAEIRSELLVTAIAQNTLPRLGLSHGPSGGLPRHLQTETPGHQRLSVPDHSPLRVGTLNGIVRAVATHKGLYCQALLDSLR